MYWLGVPPPGGGRADPIRREGGRDRNAFLAGRELRAQHRDAGTSLGRDVRDAHAVLCAELGRPQRTLPDVGIAPRDLPEPRQRCHEPRALLLPVEWTATAMATHRRLHRRYWGAP